MMAWGLFYQLDGNVWDRWDTSPSSESESDWGGGGQETDQSLEQSQVSEPGSLSSRHGMGEINGHYKYPVWMWLCVEFFAVGKIKDFVNSSEDVLNEFPVLSLVIAITQKTKFCCKCQQFLGFLLLCQNTGSHNRMHFAGNKQPEKTLLVNARKRQTRAWRHFGGNLAALAR